MNQCGYFINVKRGEPVPHGFETIDPPTPTSERWAELAKSISPEKLELAKRRESQRLQRDVLCVCQDAGLVVAKDHKEKAHRIYSCFRHAAEVLSDIEARPEHYRD